MSFSTPLNVNSHTKSRIQQAYDVVGHIALDGFGFVSDSDRAAFFALLLSAANLDQLAETPVFVTTGGRNCGKSLAITAARVAAGLSDPHDDEHFPLNAHALLPWNAARVVKRHFLIRLDASKIAGQNRNPVGYLLNNRARLRDALRVIVEIGTRVPAKHSVPSDSWSQVILTAMSRLEINGRSAAELAMDAFVNRGAAEVKTAA